MGHVFVCVQIFNIERDFRGGLHFFVFVIKYISDSFPHLLQTKWDQTNKSERRKKTTNLQINTHTVDKYKESLTIFTLEMMKLFV